MSKASLLELCHGEKKYVILNNQVKILTSQYIGTCKVTVYFSILFTKK